MTEQFEQDMKMEQYCTYSLKRQQRGEKESRCAAQDWSWIDKRHKKSNQYRGGHPVGYASKSPDWHVKGGIWSDIQQKSKNQWLIIGACTKMQN